MDERPLSPLAAAIAASSFSVHIPNEQVFGRVTGQRHVEVWFAAGHYEQVATGKLEQELATLARLLFVGGLKENARLTREVTGWQTSARPLLGRRDKEYGEFLSELVVDVTSDDGSVSLTATGQQNYAVRIEPGALDRVPRETFQVSCGQVADRLLAETESQAARAKWRLYEPVPGMSLEDLDAQAARG